MSIAPAVTNSQTRVMGTRTFHPRSMSWSILSRGMLQRIHWKVNITSAVLRPNQTQSRAHRSRTSSGGCQPPRKSVVVIAYISPIEANSEAWIRAHVIPEYSTMYPPTISLSPSGRSNGTLFTSASPAI